MLLGFVSLSLGGIGRGADFVLSEDDIFGFWRCCSDYWRHGFGEVDKNATDQTNATAAGGPPATHYEITVAYYEAGGQAMGNAASGSTPLVRIAHGRRSHSSITDIIANKSLCSHVMTCALAVQSTSIPASQIAPNEDHRFSNVFNFFNSFNSFK